MPDLPPARRRLSAGQLVPAIVLAAAVAAVFLAPANVVIGGADTDMIMQFLSWRAYAAHTLLSGHLPLWNPYTYSGQPFLGGFQSALLYPPNVIFLFLPLSRAANLSLLLHLILLGWGMHRLAAKRGYQSLACAVCAALLPLSGAVFPHLYAGHLPNLCTMAWTPWILAGLEEFYRGGRMPGLLLASAAACLQILAGHVQYVFYTAIAAALQALFLAIGRPELRRRSLPAVAGIYAAAALLSAAQLFPGLNNIRQGIRHAKMGFDFARMFSFPIENLGTFVMPGFFGDLAKHPYWGRGYLWEMSVFVGISGLILAATALLDPGRRRSARFDLGLAGLLLLLALGDHTPLFGVLYHCVPGFDRFRGVSKFTFPATVFLVLAIGAGADAVIRGRSAGRALGMAAMQAGGFALLAGLVLRSHPAVIAGCIAVIQKTQESYLPLRTAASAGFILAAGSQAGAAAIRAGLILVVLGAGLAGAARRPVLRWLPIALLPIEMAIFAASHFAATNASRTLPLGLAPFVARHPGNYRIFDAYAVNNGFLLGAPDIWGNDPTPLSRYAEFITASQGGDPDQSAQTIDFHSFPAVYQMLRFRYAFIPTRTGLTVNEQVRKPMDEVQLISDYRIARDRRTMLATLMRPGFDPRRTVLLESIPYPRPAPNPQPGTARVVASTPDSLTIEADAASPTLLLVTDLYSPYWRARALAGSAQALYDVMPANYILRAIPLSPGHHHILLEYVPGGFRLGLGVSALAWMLWALLCFRQKRGAPAAGHS